MELGRHRQKKPTNHCKYAELSHTMDQTDLPKLKPPPLKISVIIPTYNRHKCVMRAVQSVLDQSIPPHEVIVVDDGSTDQTAQLFVSCDPRIQYIVKENGGVSSARNRGIQDSSGDWIAFLDGG